MDHTTQDQAIVTNSTTSEMYTKKKIIIGM